MTVAAAAASGGVGGRRYALLLALNDSEYARKVYGGYGNVFVSALGGGGGGGEEERWDCFRVIDGEFPAAEEVGRYEGFVVSGSPHDAYGDERWILRLCSLLRALHAMGKRILGICFGHQVLCRALGGRIGKARSGWNIGVKKMTFVRDFEGSKLFGDLKEIPQSASIIEVHQDEVLEVPPMGRVLAYSDKTPVEMFAVGDNVLGIQGHPEYTSDILLNLIDRLVNNNTITSGIGEEARRTVEASEPDRRFWTGLCKGFLKRPTAATTVDMPPREVAPEMMSCSHIIAGGHFVATTPIGL
ncbi:gamma-glutamyl peptidase 5 [Oryza sativa Japonica Group]|uniref:Os02g0179200 protein n=2 Tax=Oryza sativa subsp. japonica TaxID=39947 RepID=Q6ETL5_ORYSJ|nr:gamma-glutamyl peptidase 5 [Oryza sativa Japonica Group]EAZ21962.1 hypothetical protein OsJ_05615 [Oryza sativa Japonica Group]KAF2943426.1 hypothetical protein DAI22_02g062400 [Oryza sativa Japonica Group]BAD28005.1 putative glutamine amidotransferase class-I domain-containing protein [Oryza sativa Japonica Group]BAF07996.1 Os02g0179200 [Oryza sativa Japonica Group]BAG99225.1 unnamed protein product [Oryza sativa Japonica Group]|eukprot:NP_001046082.1 Os02g0179200 [Oryza sativa Japonica Group]